MNEFATLFLISLLSLASAPGPAMAAPDIVRGAEQIRDEADHAGESEHAHGEEGSGHSEGEEHAGDHADQGDEPKDQAHEGHGEHEEEGVITLSSRLLGEFGARVATAEGGVIRQQVSLPGEVQLNKEAVAQISPRFPAKIVEVRAKTGDTVRAGQILAVAESSETLTRFELKSLIDGVVINRDITLGEHLSPDDTAFLVADLSTLWVDIALFPKQVPLVKVGQPVYLKTSHGPEPVSTRIDYVAPLVNEATRTGLARVFLDNEGQAWKPGMFIEADIAVGEYPASVVVPRSAVIEVEQRPVVFVATAEGWEPRPVELGRNDVNSVEIVQGLQPGERYVAEGGFVLKAQLQKDEFESGHSH